MPCKNNCPGCTCDPTITEFSVAVPADPLLPAPEPYRCDFPACKARDCDGACNAALPPEAASQPMAALGWARDWIDQAPHGDNCYLSSHYEGDPGNRCNCGKEALLAALEPILDGAQSADPLDMRLPCDVTIGGGTHRKGTSLRTLVRRAQRLWEEAYGPMPSDEEKAANLQRLQAVADRALSTTPLVVNETGLGDTQAAPQAHADGSNAQPARDELLRIHRAVHQMTDLEDAEGDTWTVRRVKWLAREYVRLNQALSEPRPASCERLRTGKCGCTAYCGAYLGLQFRGAPQSAPACTNIGDCTTPKLCLSVGTCDGVHVMPASVRASAEAPPQAVASGRNPYYAGQHGAEGPQDTADRLALVAERDEARAEVERLRALLNAAREALMPHMALCAGTSVPNQAAQVASRIERELDAKEPT